MSKIVKTNESKAQKIEMIINLLLLPIHSERRADMIQRTKRSESGLLDSNLNLERDYTVVLRSSLFVTKFRVEDVPRIP